jgi:hypothetical protein
MDAPEYYVIRLLYLLILYCYAADRKTRTNCSRYILFPVEFSLLYSLGCLWILISGFAALKNPLSIRRVTDERLSGIGGINDSDTPEYLSQGHFVRHESHMDCALHRFSADSDYRPEPHARS